LIELSAYSQVDLLTNGQTDVESIAIFQVTSTVESLDSINLSLLFFNHTQLQ